MLTPHCSSAKLTLISNSSSVYWATESSWGAKYSTAQQILTSLLYFTEVSFQNLLVSFHQSVPTSNFCIRGSRCEIIHQCMADFIAHSVEVYGRACYVCSRNMSSSIATWITVLFAVQTTLGTLCISIFAIVLFSNLSDTALAVLLCQLWIGKMNKCACFNRTSNSHYCSFRTEVTIVLIGCVTTAAGPPFYFQFKVRWRFLKFTVQSRTSN